MIIIIITIIIVVQYLFLEIQELIPVVGIGPIAVFNVSF